MLQHWLTREPSLSFGLPVYLFAAILVVRRRFRREQGPIVSLLAVMLVLGFFMRDVAWQAHLGGLAGGAAVGLVLVRAPRERRALWQWGGIAAVAVVLVVLAAVGLVTA